jgi:hypothetical protein
LQRAPYHNCKHAKRVSETGALAEEFELLLSLALDTLVLVELVFWPFARTVDFT